MSIDRLCIAIGVRAALRLMQFFGGTRIYVPIRIDSDHRIARVIGIDAAKALERAARGEQLEIPRGDIFVRARRDREIRKARAPISRLAQQYGLTERRVRQIRREN